ncbi:hypothetical protein DFH08DRAFT_1021499 [Mycena albidolilacea]|uniref:Uncharacterized protein n=1 Tax=Mycena albidolilacea TaxID=1033008 RepID=A0AAD7EJK8_9AGAR|nr:hypothetical protein DFH08DRAFT_1021499 [Mycena albidolilacea]
MFKLAGLIVLAAVQLGAFCVAAVTPDPLAPGSNFSVALTNLENAAAAFTSAPFSESFPPNIPAYEGIFALVKGCSDSYDAAGIQLAAFSPTISGGFLSASNAARLNTTVPSIQGSILSRLNSLQAGKAFFESVNNNLLLLNMYCHWIGNLSRETAFFLSILRVGAPSADYASSWSQLGANAAFQYNILLTKDGFNCGSNP